MTTNEVEIRSAFFVAQKPTGGEKMYLEPNNPSLSFANFLDAAISQPHYHGGSFGKVGY